jgi:RNA recognition motif-containing protein
MAGSAPLSLYVNNFSKRTTKDELKSLFSRAGCAVKMIVVPVGKKGGKGIAYVHCEDEGSVESGLALHQTQFNGSEINVVKNFNFNEKKEKTYREATEEIFTVYVNQLPYTLTEPELLKLFTDADIKVHHVRMAMKGKRFKGMAFIDFATEDSRNKAMKLDKTIMGGRTINIQIPHTKEAWQENANGKAASKRAAAGVCYAYQRGECTRGDYCKFDHQGVVQRAPQPYLGTRVGQSASSYTAPWAHENSGSSSPSTAPANGKKLSQEERRAIYGKGSKADDDLSVKPEPVLKRAAEQWGQDEAPQKKTKLTQEERRAIYAKKKELDPAPAPAPVPDRPVTHDGKKKKLTQEERRAIYAKKK